MHTVAHAVTKSAFSLHSSNAVHGHIKVILGKFLFGAAILDIINSVHCECGMLTRGAYSLYES